MSLSLEREESLQLDRLRISALLVFIALAEFEALCVQTLCDEYCT